MIKKRQLAKIIIAYFICMGLFCRYIEHYALWKIISLLLIGIMLIDQSFRATIKKIHLGLAFALLMIIITCSCFFSNSREYIVGNLLYIIWPLLYLCTLCGIVNNYDRTIEKFLDRLFVPLNFIFVINILLALIQTTGNPLLIKKTWLAYNSFYEDLCCGLFGLNGTHELTSFSLFMNIYVLSYADKKKKRKHIYSYLAIADFLLLFLSTRNDNVAMFVLLPLFICLFIVLRIHINTGNLLRTIKKIGRMSIAIVIILLVIINIPYSKNYMDKYVWIRINMLLNFNKSYFQIAGSNERLAIVFDALSSTSGWLFGRGFGAADLGGGNYFGYGSFGLSSIGSFIMIGGIWFYLLFTYQIAKELQYLVNRKLRLDFFCVVAFLVVIIYTVYTILYTSFVSMLWIGFIFLEIGFNKRRVYTDNANIQFKIKDRYRDRV